MRAKIYPVLASTDAQETYWGVWLSFGLKCGGVGTEHNGERLIASKMEALGVARIMYLAYGGKRKNPRIKICRTRYEAMRPPFG